MAKELLTIPFEEFASNANEILERVLLDRETVIVEAETGERALIKPARPKSWRQRSISEADRQAFLSSAGGWADLDAERFLADTYDSRRIRTRPPVEL